MTTNEQTPVLVAGGGLAGLTAAVFLALHGVRPLLVEKHATTSMVMKARGQYPHTMEALRIAGVADAITAASPGGQGDFFMAIARTLSGPVLQGIMTRGEMNMNHVSPEEWAMASQERTEAILAERAQELGADLRFGTELVSFEQDAEGVTALLRTASGAERTVRARYLIGADGWRSPVRNALGIGTHGRGTLGHVFRAFFDADLSQQLQSLDGVSDGRRFALFHLLNSAGPGVFYTTDVPGRYGYIRGMTPEPTDYRDYTEDQVVAIIRRGLDAPDLPLKVVETGETPIVCYTADVFGSGRAFLVGDAARVVPAPGGLGGNTAIMDAFYLAWKLAAVVRGFAGPGLLDTHDAERRPVAEMIAEQQYANTVERLAPELKDDSVPAQISPVTQVFGYRYAHGAVVPEPGDARELLEDPTKPTGRPGSRAPHVPLRAGDEVTSTIRLFGRSFVLLTGSAEWPDAAAEVSARTGIPLVAHRIGGPELSDPDGRWLDAYGVTDAGAVLVRPDRFIAWRSPGAGTPDDLEQALRTALFLPEGVRA